MFVFVERDQMSRGIISMTQGNFSCRPLGDGRKKGEAFIIVQSRGGFRLIGEYYVSNELFPLFCSQVANFTRLESICGS